MNDAHEPMDGLVKGRRIPNFVLPVADGRRLILYEFVAGRPLLLAAAPFDWPDLVVRRFADQVHEAARRHDFQSVVVLDEVLETPSTDTERPNVHDAQGKLHRLFLAPHDPHSEGVLHVSDPNLRIVQSAAVEAEAVKGEGLREGLDSLLEGVLEELETERDNTPSVAPVLVVPRVLGPKLCRGLIESFGRSKPKASIMPTGDGHAVDVARKSRLDVIIEDDRLETELAKMIAQRVFPEIHKAFQFQASRMERLKLVCYRARDAGHFAAHRDNTAPTTVHRRFGLTVNLNAGEYEGGQVEFPEYGADCAYDVPAGAALLFSGTHAHRVRPVTEGERYALVSFAFGETVS